ncbi:hypothetical protein BGZ98_003556 [Dissophora globulifera]|nr:hypothetical protein BGZ98_003556 [Dissophora globulifera]
MPEIITLIGHCLPLWKYSERLGFYDFNPRILLKCTRVNKIWHDALVPLIWYIYNGYVMRSIPKDVIIKNSRYFRVFFYDRCFSGPFLCQNLRALSISWWDSSLLPLVEANAGSLENLIWKGSTSTSPMRTMTLPKLDHSLFMRMAPTLEELQLSHWTIVGPDFVRFLGACKRLQYLSLAAVDWVEPGLINSILPASPSSLSSSPSATSVPWSTVIPPQIVQNLKDLRLDISVSRDGAFIDLIRSCPHLENFSLYSESAEDARMLVPVLRHSCFSKLRGIEYVTRFSSALDGYDYLTDAEYSDMILSADTITHLKIDIPQLGDAMTRALILQASSLQSLSLRFLRRRDMPMQDAENLCKILKYCIRLRSLSLVFSPHALGQEETLRLFDEPWGCVELEKLELTDVTMVATEHREVEATAGDIAAAVTAAAGEMYYDSDLLPHIQQPRYWTWASASSSTPPDAGAHRAGNRNDSVARQRLFEQVRKLGNLTRLTLNHVTYSADGTT